MAYQLDVDLDPAGTVRERIDEATSQVSEDQHDDAAHLRDVTAVAAQSLADLAPPAKGKTKRTLTVVGHVGDGQAKLAVTVRVG